MLVMLNIIKKIYNNIDDKRYKIIIIFLIFLFVVFVRIFFEFKLTMIDLSVADIKRLYNFEHVYFTTYHWILWYISVFLVVFCCFRYVLNVDKKRILYISFFAPIILLPILYAVLSNKQMGLDYLSFYNVRSLKESFYSIITLYKNSKYNYFFFPEMLTLVLGLPFVSYYFSKNIFKSILNTLVVYFSIPIFCGFIYVCLIEKFCPIVVKTAFIQSIFCVLYWTVLSFIFFIFFIFPELVSYIKSKDNIFKIKYYLISMAIYLPYLLLVVSKTKYTADIALLSVIFFYIFYIILFLTKHWKEEKYRDIAYFLLIYIILILSVFLSYNVWLLTS